MAELPKSFGGPGMAMSEYYNPDSGGPGEDYDEDDEENAAKNKNNRVPFHGNDKTMNMNPLILANVTNSPYFKTDLIQMKTIHEIIDEIYYKVDHLEPWERGTRKTAGMSQTGMCGGVRGVSAGGVISSAFCLLFKVHTVRPTKKQIYMMLNHCDSPYIRGIGFMYLRYTLPPMEIWKWFEGWLDDEEMIDIKAGGGKNMTMGEFCRLLLTKMEWFETRFPRIAVNAEKQIREKMDEKFRKIREAHSATPMETSNRDSSARDGDRKSRGRSRSRSKDRSSKKKSRSRSRSKKKKKSRSRERKRSHERKRSRERRSRSKDKKSKKEKKSKRSRSRSKDRRRSRDRDYDRRSRDKDGSYADELKKYKDMKKSRRSRSRS